MRPFPPYSLPEDPLISWPKMTQILRRMVFVSGFILIGVSSAFAGIGGIRPQVMAEATRSGFSLTRTDQHSKYTALTFHRSERSRGMGLASRDLTVREFFDKTGRSFGVAWEGSLPPDLSSLLGPLFSHLPKVNRSPNRHRFFFKDQRLEISIIGTPRFQAGQALDRKYLPTGVTRDQVRIAP